MRLLGTAALLCLVIAAACTPAFAATPDELGSDAILELAADFSDSFVREGPVGLWVRIQACYKKASSPGDGESLPNCIIMDEAAKALDDNYVRALGGTVPNREWYKNAAFSERMKTYSQAAFGDPNAYVDLWEKNKKEFGTALRKLNLQPLPVR